jgi:hypothetical protein
MKKLSLNDLQELQDLLIRITSEIDKFKHVSDFLPKSLTNEIEKFDNKVNNELDRRDDEF